MTYCFIFSTSTGKGEFAASVRSTPLIVSVCTVQSVLRGDATSSQKEVADVPGI